MTAAPATDGDSGQAAAKREGPADEAPAPDASAKPNQSDTAAKPHQSGEQPAAAAAAPPAKPDQATDQPASTAAAPATPAKPEQATDQPAAPATTVATPSPAPRRIRISGREAAGSRSGGDSEPATGGRGRRERRPDDGDHRAGRGDACSRRRRQHSDRRTTARSRQRQIRSHHRRQERPGDHRRILFGTRLRAALDHRRQAQRQARRRRSPISARSTPTVSIPPTIRSRISPR